MKIEQETLRTALMALSTLIAVLSFRNTVKLWKKTNRPIVSAFVETESSDGNIATTYNLLVINSGNRPAIDIQLQLNIEDLEKCITQPINDPKIESILKCFNNDGVIPLLVAGAKISNYFGLISIKPEDNVWKYGSSLPIKIIYKDLEEDQWYTSALTLVVKDSNTFAGTQWGKKKYKREDVVKLLQEILDSLKKS